MPRTDRHDYSLAHLTALSLSPPELVDAAAEAGYLFPGEGGIDIHGILDALPPGLPYALELPRATLVAQVGGAEHARLSINAARRHLDGAPSLPVGGT